MNARDGRHRAWRWQARESLEGGRRAGLLFSESRTRARPPARSCHPGLGCQRRCSPRRWSKGTVREATSRGWLPPRNHQFRATYPRRTVEPRGRARRDTSSEAVSVVAESATLLVASPDDTNSLGRRPAQRDRRRGHRGGWGRRHSCRTPRRRPGNTFSKTNTQGFESQGAAGADKVLPLLAADQLERSLFELDGGRELLDTFRGRMADHGPPPFNLEPGICSATSQMLQCHGVFVRLGPHPLSRSRPTPCARLPCAAAAIGLVLALRSLPAAVTRRTQGRRPATPGRRLCTDPQVQACLRDKGITLPAGRTPGGRPPGGGSGTQSNAVPPSGADAPPRTTTDPRRPGGGGGP